MDVTHDNLTLVGVHIPDENAGPFDNAQQAQAAGYDTLNPVTGTYQIGVMIEGAFVPLISEKASLVFDKIDVAKQSADQAQSQPSEPAPETGPQTVQQPPVEQAPQG